MTRLIGTILSVVALVLLAGSALAGENLSRLTVRGEAELMIPADQVQMAVGVTTSAQAVEEALEENSRRMRRVREALQEEGLAEDEMRTGQFRIQPQWSRRPKKASSDWQPKITGYTVRNSLQVETQKLKLIGDLIEEAIAAGANEVNSIRFGLADPRRHRAAAIAKAVAAAQADASALALAASVDLVRLIDINLDNAAVVVPGPRPAVMAQTRLAKAEMAPPISPGDVPVRARVTLAYEVVE